MKSFTCTGTYKFVELGPIICALLEADFILTADNTAGTIGEDSAVGAIETYRCPGTDCVYIAATHRIEFKAK
jgi:hypothetical protein